ncbi:MAG: nicotinate phosphoribosyltransferase [Spirochaetales bacterium]|nr:nicotinate phosphoribosyltransferase [Spirochaetales bacterium]
MKPSSNYVNPLLTDLYQITMAYAYFKSGSQDKEAVFDLFFRKNPFNGAFTIFAGLEECLGYIENFKFTDEQTRFLKSKLIPNCDPEFFEWLKTLNTRKLKVHAVSEGTVVFPREPLLRVEGPLAVCQLLETTLLTCINYASLVCTNAARFRIAAGFDKVLLEFGLRRAQGPDGGISASRYTYMGSVDGTSNVLAGMLFDIPVKGTHAHAFVQSFKGFGDLKDRLILKGEDNKELSLLDEVLKARKELGFINTNEGELAAFIAYASAFPEGFLALVDTYDTLNSGVPNFLCVAVALARAGFKPAGIRLDSGDLSYLSRESRKMFSQVAQETGVDFSGLKIAASNDINEEVLLSLDKQGHEIDIFGIGTNLVTCQAQPALGCVYKLVEIEGSPRIKLSQQVEKVTIPGAKDVYRLFSRDDTALADIMVKIGEEAPKPGEKILCRHPFDEIKRVIITPTRVQKLTNLVWDGRILHPLPELSAIRKSVLDQLAKIRDDYARPVNPASYKVSVTDTLYKFIHELWENEAPVAEIS